MGYELNRFEGEVDEELICPICSGVLEEPLQVTLTMHKPIYITVRHMTILDTTQFRGQSPKVHRLHRKRTINRYVVVSHR